MKKRICIVLYFFVTFVIVFIGIDRFFSVREKRETIVIAAKSRAESQILSEMMSILIEKETNLKVIKKYNLEGAFVTFNAMRAEDVDIFPGFTGTALVSILKKKPIADPEESYRVVKEEFLKRFNIIWLKPFGFKNNYALVMLKKKAEELNIKTMTDAALYDLQYGFDPEFVAREEFKLMTGKYNLHFKKPSKIMEHILLYFSLANESIDIMDGFTTDGNIRHYDLEVLKDDKEAFPSYVAAPLVRGEILKRYPELKEILEKLGGTISDEEMQRMNYEADYEGKDIVRIAKEFLKKKGLFD